MYKVYIKVDEENRLIDINSDVFLTDTTEWIEIDEGWGDKYHHAQNNYLNESFITDEGPYRYKFVNGVIQPRTDEEIAADIPTPVEPNPDTEKEVAALKTEVANLNEQLAAAKILLGVE